MQPVYSVFQKSLCVSIFAGSPPYHEGVDWTSVSNIMRIIQNGEGNCPFEERYVNLLDGEGIGHLTFNGKSRQVFIMAGGHCSSWDKQISSFALNSLRKFVEQGGHYIGICAGAYFGCKFVEYACGDSTLKRARELPGFFPGHAIGPLFPDNANSDRPWHPAIVDLRWKNGQCGRSILLGGGYFVPPAHFRKYEVLARYTYLGYDQEAIIRIPIQSGTATLCFPHLEFDIESFKLVMGDALLGSVNTPDIGSKDLYETDRESFLLKSPDNRSEYARASEKDLSSCETGVVSPPYLYGTYESPILISKLLDNKSPSQCQSDPESGRSPKPGNEEARSFHYTYQFLQRSGIQTVEDIDTLPVLGFEVEDIAEETKDTLDVSGSRSAGVDVMGADVVHGCLREDNYQKDVHLVAELPLACSKSSYNLGMVDTNMAAQDVRVINFTGLSCKQDPRVNFSASIESKCGWQVRLQGMEAFWKLFEHS